MKNYDFAIVRPYVTLPEESGGVDRYLTLHSQLNIFGVKTILFCSNFSHIHKQKRSNIQLENIHLINAGSYNRNISISRILYEVKFSYLVLKKLQSTNIKAVLVGEPLFMAWVFMLILKITKNIKIFSDFIDLMPEALMIKFENKFIFKLLTIPFFLTRLFRVNFVYNKNFFVSKYYVNTIKCSNPRNGGVIYWGCKKPFHIKNRPIRDPKCIVYAGSLGEGYDIQTIIDLALIRPDLNIIIAGSGPKSNICSDANKAGIIDFMGHVDAEKLDEIYSRASIGLIPYNKNSAVSMPIKFFDYISAGLKIVNSLADMECGEIIINKSIGINYQAGNLQSLVKAVDSAIDMTVSPCKFVNLSTEMEIERQYTKFAQSIAQLI